jgi:anti-anti-sigma regulatory factor
MAGRFRHGLHVVRDGDAPSAEEVTPILPNAAGHPFLSLDQQSVVLAIAGRLNADTAGRLGMFLAMSSVVGGPRELVLDLSDVVAVDEDGMAPIFEADEAMCRWNASLRLASVSTAVSSFLQDVRVPPIGRSGRENVGARPPGLPARHSREPDPGRSPG